MPERNHLLIETNRTLLEQGLELLEELSDGAYALRLAELGGASIGGHMRHVLEFYECFLEGLANRRVDYDSRVRDAAVENNRAAASPKIRTFLERLQSEPLLSRDEPLQVRMEDAPQELAGDAFLASSTERELQVLLSHTTHHFALIAVGLRLQGLAVDPRFGVALSTLRYWESGKAAA